MATHKQRRRREKEKRHDYDLVEIDDEGNETVVRATELRPAARPPQRVKKGEAAPVRGGGRREPKPPSWSRVIRRAAIFGPVFFLVILLLGGSKTSVAAALIQTVFLVVIFVPFSYFMDRFVWRSYQKRLVRTRRS
jgi:hypothetical protein